MIRKLGRLSLRIQSNCFFDTLGARKRCKKTKKISSRSELFGWLSEQKPDFYFTDTVDIRKYQC